MFFRREHPDYLRTSPSDHVIDTAAIYFPGLDVGLLQQWWVYVDDGGSVSSEDVGFAIQYAVVHNFIRNTNQFRTEDQAKAYIALGIQAESEGINALKGTGTDVEAESEKLAYAALLNVFTYPDVYYQETHSMHSSYSSGSSTGWY